MTGDLICLGDSITFGSGATPAGRGARRGWVTMVAEAINPALGAAAPFGFRGTWLDEWTATGPWQRRSEPVAVDGAPFGRVLLPTAGSGCATWRPAAGVDGAEVIVEGGAAGWEYRVDDGDWHGARFEASRSILASMIVEGPIWSALELRRAARAPQVGGAAIVGVIPNAAAARGSIGRGAIVHNVALPEGLLSEFCRPTEGDPFAVLDHIDAATATVLFSNDVVFENEAKFAARLERLVGRLSGRARVLVMSTFEQRPARSVPGVTCEAESRVLTTFDASFDDADAGRHVSGEGIAPGTTITMVESARSVVVDRSARTSGIRTVQVGFRRSAASQAQHRRAAARIADAHGVDRLDLFDLWAGIAGAPGFDPAMRNGLMADALHPSPRGHEVIARAVLDWLTGS